ncbi:hypothetical protein I6G82_02560 [Lysinibacillus macroides]|uniref:Uncharacterized protein n=1 Tax=Lysinibacillus macroides TaxID=33935 RepID=A0A0N0UWF5_9BACI|nr:hypothetical protein [Lysinibacillus macroides]KOY81304.1 hypothetical protein ADM90_19410 [Lysinibacillus macroides]QPR68533.1 hypothetical protein I6G82_02560 [Lysinibacillus macroides]
MLKIEQARLVTTHEIRECFGCAGGINKGETAVFITVMDQNIGIYLHQVCNVKIVNNKNALDSIYYGCLNDIEPTPQCQKKG